MTNLDMTENTLQFMIKLVGVLVFTIMAVTLGTLAFLVIHDGNNPLVQTAFQDLVDLGKWGLIIIGTIITGKPIASGMGQFLANKNPPQQPINSPIISQNNPENPSPSA